MEGNWISIVLITMIVPPLPVLLLPKMERKASDLRFEKFEASVFRVAKWWYVINTIGVVLPASFFYFSYDIITKNGVHWAAFYLFFIGLIFFIMVVYNYYNFPRMYIAFRDGNVSYFNGRKTKFSIETRLIRHAYVANGYIYIDVGEKYKKVIPVIYFQKPYRILAI